MQSISLHVQRSNKQKQHPYAVYASDVQTGKDNSVHRVSEARPSHSVSEMDVYDKDWAFEILALVFEGLNGDVVVRGEACDVGS